jgi:Na+/proline symporter
MKGAGYVLSAVTREAIPDWAGAALVYGVVLIYVLRSGVLGVGWTNTFQGLFMMVLAWGLGLYLPHALYGGVGPMFDRLAAERPELLLAPGLTSGGEPWSWGEYSSAIVVSVVGFSVWPHLFMKAFTARDERTIRRTVVLYPTFQVFLVPLFLIGFCGVFFESAPERADQVLPHMLMNMELPALLVGLFCAGALAASMSSGDAVVQFAPAVVATLYARKVDAHGVLAGLLAGSAVTVVLVLWPDLRPWPVHAGLYGLAVNLAALGIVTRWFGRGGSLDLRAFYDGIVPADEADGDGDGQRICEGDCGQQAGRAVPRPSVQDRRAVRYAPLPRV